MSEKRNCECQITPLLLLSLALCHQGGPFPSGLLFSQRFRAPAGSCRVSGSSGAFCPPWGWALCSQALSTPGFCAPHGLSCSFQKVLAALWQPPCPAPAHHHLPEGCQGSARGSPRLPIAAWRWGGLSCNSRISRKMRCKWRRKEYQGLGNHRAEEKMEFGICWGFS